MDKRSLFFPMSISFPHHIDSLRNSVGGRYFQKKCFISWYFLMKSNTLCYIVTIFKKQHIKLLLQHFSFLFSFEVLFFVYAHVSMTYCSLYHQKCGMSVLHWNQNHNKCVTPLKANYNFFFLHLRK